MIPSVEARYLALAENFRWGSPTNAVYHEPGSLSAAKSADNQLGIHSNNLVKSIASMVK
jgi:hypothetical protein